VWLAVGATERARVVGIDVRVGVGGGDLEAKPGGTGV
jgi:hypothetical protein